MNIIQILFFVWLGVYGHFMNLLKQILFQGQNITKEPWKYLKNKRFIGNALVLAGIAQGTWLFDAFIRQRLKISEFYSFSSLITAPISILTMFAVLWFSERNLADKINWWAVGLWGFGTLLSMWGAILMLKGNS